MKKITLYELNSAVHNLLDDLDDLGLDYSYRMDMDFLDDNFRSEVLILEIIDQTCKFDVKLELAVDHFCLLRAKFKTETLKTYIRFIIFRNIAYIYDSELE